MTESNKPESPDDKQTRRSSHCSSSSALVDALRVLSRDIQSGDGVANSCVAEAADMIESLVRQRDAAVKMLADWCVAIDEKGGGWDEWDEHYKDAMYRKTDLPEMRAILDVAIEESRKRWNEL